MIDGCVQTANASQPRAAVPPKSSPNRRLKRGERPVGGPAARGAWGKFKIDAAELDLPGRIRWADRTQEDQAANTESKATTSLGVLGRSEQLRLCNHSARKPRPCI